MKALIFGASGQDGHYLNKILTESGFEVTGITRSGGNWTRGDVANPGEVEELVRTLKPDHIYHLAANSTTRHEVLFENHETISTGTLNILEAVYRHSPASKVFLSGSAMQFRNDGKPIHEETPFEASSPYSVARIQSVYAARYYRKLGVKAYVGYFFNHESPLRTPRHVSSMIAGAVRAISRGDNQHIELGDIKVRKEWNFAGDFARAIFQILNQEEQFELVIGSGKAYSIEDFLEVCFRQIGKDWRDFVILKEGFIPEYQLLVSDPKRLFGIGYRPELDIEELAKLMIETN